MDDPQYLFGGKAKKKHCIRTVDTSIDKNKTSEHFQEGWMNTQRIKGSVLAGSLLVLLLLTAGSANTLVARAQPVAAASVNSNNRLLIPLLTPICGQFYDVNSYAYFYQGVVFLNCRNVISGYPCNSRPDAPCVPPDNLPWFLPYNNVIRGQLAKIVSEGYGYNDQIPSNQQTYQDILPGSTFWVYIERIGTYRNIMTGYACGGPNEPCIPPLNRPYFRWNANADRNTIAKAAVQAAGYSLINPPTPTFRDVPVTSQFYTYIETAYAHHILDGYPCGAGCVDFRPTENTIRGQIAKIIANTRFYIQYEEYPVDLHPYQGSNNFDYGFSSPLTYGLRTIPSGLLNGRTVGTHQYRVEVKDMLYTAAAKQYIMNTDDTRFWFPVRVADSTINCISGQYSNGFTNIPGIFIGSYFCGGAPELEITVPTAIDTSYRYSTQFTYDASTSGPYWSSIQLLASTNDDVQGYKWDYMAEICYKNSTSSIARCPEPFPARNR
jgi:hypothetical protein